MPAAMPAAVDALVLAAVSVGLTDPRLITGMALLLATLGLLRLRRTVTEINSEFPVGIRRRR